MKHKIYKALSYGGGTASIIFGVFLIKDYCGGEKYLGKENLNGKVCIVTGSNTGIGKEVVRDLAKREAKVVMACRDLHKCDEAREEIVLETMNKYIYCRKCDLASQASIRAFVNEFKKEHNRLDILINNAGVMRCPQSVTEDGIEMQLGVNYMGHFLLTNLLLETIKASAPSRIVNVSSVSHFRGKINMQDLNSNEKYDAGDAYNQSKLAIILFTKELARRLEGSKVAVNSVHPGLVDTEITRHLKFLNSTIVSIILNPFIWLFIRRPYQGAQTILYAALSPEMKDVSGEYLSNCKIVQTSDDAQNEQMAKWLWLTSEKWTKLKDS